MIRRKQKSQKLDIPTTQTILGQPGIGKSRVIEDIGKALGWKATDIRLAASPITARMVIHRITGVIEVGVGGYFLLLAFLHHDAVYDIFKGSKLAFVVAGIAIAGFWILHDGIHRVTDKLEIEQEGYDFDS